MKKQFVRKLKKKLDIIFSKYIRARDKYKCYTCGVVLQSRFSQCGHFVPRQYNNVRYDEINCHCQCYACNMFYGGQPSEYALRLQKDYGSDIIEKLNKKKREIKQFTPQELGKMIELYNGKLKELCKN